MTSFCVGGHRGLFLLIAGGPGGKCCGQQYSWEHTLLPSMGALALSVVPTYCPTPEAAWHPIPHALPLGSTAQFMPFPKLQASVLHFHALNELGKARTKLWCKVLGLRSKTCSCNIIWRVLFSMIVSFISAFPRVCLVFNWLLLIVLKFYKPKLANHLILAGSNIAAEETVMVRWSD